MRTILVALAALAAPASAQVQPGEYAPEFELSGLDGEQVTLTELSGEVVVLEWTSHLCPAVARAQDSRLLADTRAALDSDVIWLQIDSSWYGPDLRPDIAAWRARLGLEMPYLLDAGGRVASEYGAQATPHLFVIGGDGVLAYSGRLHDDAPEAGRQNLVVEAVRALLSGEEVETERTRAVGCTLKLEVPRAGMSPAEFDEDARANASYREAALAAQANRLDDACRLFERAVEEGLPRPWQVVADDAFAPLLAQADPRLGIRAALSEPARGSLTMISPAEPGSGLVIAGVVSDEQGEPIPGAVVALYHTDAAGYYSPGSTSGENARLFGSVATDRSGRYRIRTVMPGHYADSPGVPLHLHMGTRAEGFRAAEGHRASVYFENDPALIGANLEEIRSDGCVILPLAENAEGVALAVHDIVLRSE